jgi:hypothetical protein
MCHIYIYSSRLKPQAACKFTACSFDWWLMAGADLQIYSLLVTADNLACENSQCTPKHENRGTGKAAAAIVASTVR